MANNNSLNISQQKIYPYLDILRICACYFVVLNHSLAAYILSGDNTHIWIFSFIPFFISRTAIPIFLMLSGSLSLGKVDSYRKSLLKALKMTLILIMISALYTILINNRYVGGNFFEYILSLKDYVFDWIVAPVSNALWYMYLYIAILITIPILQRLNKNLKNKDYLYIFVFSIVCNGGIDLFTHYTPFKNIYSQFNLSFFAVEIGLLFVGYYLHKYVKLTKAHFIFSVIAYASLTCLNMILTYREFSINDSEFLFLNKWSLINITIPSICFFVIIKYMFENIKLPQKSISALREIGNCTFGAYLLGDLIINIFDKNLLKLLDASFPTLISRLIFAVAVMTVSMVITFLLRRISIFKKLL